MTVVTGLVDSFSYLLLGHVFVANMTGNVVFLAFAVVGSPRLLHRRVGGGAGRRSGWDRSSVGGSSRGSAITGAITSRWPPATQALLLAVAMVLALVGSHPFGSGVRYALIVVLGLAMGVQNSSVRRLAVPDLTTTVLTLTVTGIGADSALGGGKGSKSGRRLISVAAMFLGALAGGAHPPRACCGPAGPRVGHRGRRRRGEPLVGSVEPAVDPGRGLRLGRGLSPRSGRRLAIGAGRRSAVGG